MNVNTTTIGEWEYKEYSGYNFRVGKDVTSIGHAALASEKLGRIYVSKDNKYFTAKDKVLFKNCMTPNYPNIFQKNYVTDNYTDKYILHTYPASRVGKEYVVPDDVIEVYEYAFTGCKNLKRVKIHAGVHSISESAFFGCIKLKRIEVDKNNPFYTSVRGVLFSKDMTKLIAYPSGKKQSSYKVPYGVHRIGKGAIACTEYLEDLIVPETVVSIGERVGEDTLFNVHCKKNSIARERLGKNYKETRMEEIRRFKQGVRERQAKDKRREKLINRYQRLIRESEEAE